MDAENSRRKTRAVQVGSLAIGGNNPIRIQSMTNTDTTNTSATAQQVMELADAGCEIVRIAAPDARSAENLYNIRNVLVSKGYDVPLVADIHFNPKAAEIAASIVSKVRINPGNYVDRQRSNRISLSDKEYNNELERIKQRLFPLIEICKKNQTAIRIGTNHGSVSQRIINRYGNTPLGMAHSSMEFVRICESLGFQSLVLSIKSSNVKAMNRATLLLVSMLDDQGFNLPVHLGVTEAGEGEDGRIRSAVGIGSLLCMGIGDTIRVSLTEDPVFEIPVAQSILQSAGCRSYKAEIISCPSCARTRYDIQNAVKEVKVRCQHLTGIKIAVMGCIVNGPGEMLDADYGYIGSLEGKVHLYRKGKLISANVDEKQAIDILLNMIEKDRKGGSQ